MKNDSETVSSPYATFSQNNRKQMANITLAIKVTNSHVNDVKEQIKQQIDSSHVTIYIRVNKSLLPLVCSNNCLNKVNCIPPSLAHTLKGPKWTVIS